MTDRMLERAIAIAAEAHAGQVDRGGQPYILHPLRVMLKMAPDDDHRAAAVLHDVVEDCPDWTIDRLRSEGISETALEAIDAVTKMPWESYDDFIERAARNGIGRLVKIADLRDNSDINRIPNLTDADWKRQFKYGKALSYLMSLG
jgi:(p)ppGpp synthase/HD superfamily hydrolase